MCSSILIVVSPHLCTVMPPQQGRYHMRQPANNTGTTNKRQPALLLHALCRTVHSHLSVPSDSTGTTTRTCSGQAESSISQLLLLLFFLLLFYDYIIAGSRHYSAARITLGWGNRSIFYPYSSVGIVAPSHLTSSRTRVRISLRTLLLLKRLRVCP